MAATELARRGVSIALACRTFGISETCYRYGPNLRAENEQIADLLVGLTHARKTWGFGPVFLALAAREGPSLEPQTGSPDLLRDGPELANQTPQWLWAYNNDRPTSGIDGITSAMNLKMAA